MQKFENGKTETLCRQKIRHMRSLIALLQSQIGIKSLQCAVFFMHSRMNEQNENEYLSARMRETGFKAIILTEVLIEIDKKQTFI